MEVVSLSLNLKNNIPLTNGFTSCVYFKNKASKNRIEIGYLLNKKDSIFKMKVKDEFVSIIQYLKVSIDIHLCNGKEKIVGLCFYK